MKNPVLFLDGVNMSQKMLDEGIAKTHDRQIRK